MENQNKKREKRGTVLLEGLIASLLFLLPAIFVIDLAVTGGTVHHIGYIIHKCARKASLERGVQARTVTEESERIFRKALRKDISGGRVRGLKVSLLGKRGQGIEGKERLSGGSIVTMNVTVLLSMNFLPSGAFKIFSSRGRTFERGSQEGYVTYNLKRTFMVE